MAHPPAAIIRTLEPVGGLQLSRLDKRVRFHCTRCRKDKTHSLIATVDGNWAQTVCFGCYGNHVHAWRVSHEETKYAQNEEKLKRRLPGLEDLVTFFRDAGVDTQIVNRGCLQLNGSLTKPLAWILPSPGSVDWNYIIDDMALKYVRDKFLTALEENARFGEGHRAFLRPHDRGFVIMRDNVQVAIIHPSHAQIGHREAIYANFLRSGPHWQHVADVLRAAEPELVATWKREQEAKRGALAAMATAEAERESAATRRIDTLPGHLGPELTGACLNASRRIRLDRQVAYDRPVVLESSAGELTLLPIGATHTRLLMPFRLAKGTETLRGQLILGDRDPLPLLVGADVTDDEAVSAWAYALLGFADATCIELEARGPITHRLPTPERRPSSPVSGGHQTRTLPRRGPWPRQLEPVGHWIRYSGAFVAGH